MLAASSSRPSREKQVRGWSGLGKWRQWGETALWCSQTVLFDAVRTSESLLCGRILTNHILPYFGAKKAECRRLGNIFQNDRKLRAHRAYRETTQRLRRMKWLRMWAVPTHALSSHGRAAVRGAWPILLFLCIAKHPSLKNDDYLFRLGRAVHNLVESISTVLQSLRLL